MTPRSENPKTKTFSMRFDPDLREALQTNVDTGKGGKAGGLSLLFHQLGYLYLGQELPPQRWHVTEGSIIDLLDELEWTLDAAVAKVERGEALDDEEIKRLESSEEAVKRLISPRLDQEPTFDRLRGLVLIGRYELFLGSLEKLLED